MRRVVALILLPPATGAADTPVGWLDEARAAIAERHRTAFEEIGGVDVRVIGESGDGGSFGTRLRRLAGEAIEGIHGQVGLIVIGGGSMPLARRDDLAAFVTVAMTRARRALANSYYSADAFAVPDARMLLDVPDLPSDNAIPRWLAERADIPVADLRDRARLAFDIDSPLDVLLAARDPGCPAALRSVAERVATANPRVVEAQSGVAGALLDRRAELLVAGRTSPRSLEALHRVAACRVRALIEERGLRASTPLALGDADTWDAASDASNKDSARPASGRQRPPRSTLGLLLDDRGPEALTAIVAELADAALIDTRVLLAHRLGVDEAGWPPPSDRLASDLLRPSDVVDPWLRALTESALAAPIPVLLGGHTLVGPGLPLLARPGPTP